MERKEVIRHGLDLSNIHLQLPWEDYLDWFRQCKTTDQAVSVIRSLPYLSFPMYVTDVQKLLFLLEIANPPLANPAIVQETAFRTAGEKLLEDDTRIKYLLGGLHGQKHGLQIIENMLGLLKEVFALNRPWKTLYAATQFAKAHTRFNRFLACIYASSIGHELYRDEIVCRAVERVGYLFRPSKDQLRIMVIQRDMEDLTVQYRDAEAIKGIAAYIRSFQEPTSAVPKLFDDILTSQKARIALCKRFVLQNPPLSKCLKVLDRLMFVREVEEFRLN